ncbi:hypothetical protein [Natrinema salsiterrestre]|uniref:PH domain-containing protein n=1 Tax=Natrinema salsiterrestre TaxID=2950540 RepID=A0A9Q4L8S6_9EURY|nr:hypothetical protein [Natrinema salsiterrestre]MDF9747341.1 hypothetical protein [Natrinema salsiterrestre]
MGRNTKATADPESGPPDGVFQVVFGVYTGVIVAGSATTVVEPNAPSTIALLGTAFAAFLVGSAVGVVLTRRLHGLPVWLGRTWPRRVTIAVSMALLVLTVLVSLLGVVESRSGVVALGSTFGVAVAGLVVARCAENRYVDAVTCDEPLETWQWEPSSFVNHDRLLVFAWGGLAVIHGVSGEPLTAVTWVGLATTVVAFGPARGRVEQWLPGEPDTPPEVRVYEAGIVMTRPYMQEFVPWKSVSHVRLRNDELVIDRGFFDWRFDRDELEDPEAVLAAIERRLEEAGTR